MATLVLLDFDGTLTTKNSLADFIQFTLSRQKYYFGLFILSPILLAYKLELTPNYIAKEKLISYYFKNWKADYFQNCADRYSIDQLDNIIRPKAMERITWHQEQGHKIVIVSASMECWLKKWCVKQKIELIGTRLEVQNGKLTGRFATKNCYGIEKVNRIKEQYNLSEYSAIYAYGDSLGDKEMLSIANKRYYKHFD